METILAEQGPKQFQNKRRILNLDLTDIKRAEESIHENNEIKTTCFACNLCDYTTNDLDSIQEHTHKLEDNKEYVELGDGFQCTYCETICKRKQTIKRHIIDQHSKNNSTLKCSFCIKTFKNKNSLDKHLYRYHRELIRSVKLKK